MMSFRFHTAATPGEPGDRDGAAKHFQAAMQLEGATEKARQEAQQGLQSIKQ